MPVPARKRAKVGASVVKRPVVSGSRVSKRGIAKGASRLLVVASRVPPPLVAGRRHSVFSKELLTNFGNPLLRSRYYA